MRVDHCLLVQVFSTPSLVSNLSIKDWDLLIRQARSARLLAALYYLCLDSEALKTVPPQALNHLSSAKKQAQKTVVSALWELKLIAKIAGRVAYPVVLLKGVAYAKIGLPNSRGRIFSDVDILVSKENIASLESLLLKNGWQGDQLDAYDQIYYRKWMHEIPPLTNSRTGTSLDVHHAILPPTAKIKIDIKKLMANVVPVEGEGNLYVFSDEDIVLHSLTHLFHEGEFEHGLRDLVDLDSLMRRFSKQNQDFWNRLVERADELGLLEPLYYAFRYTRRLLNTPIPQNMINQCNKGRPMLPRVMDFLFERALMPDHFTCNGEFTSFSRWLLYNRAHYLRMPLYLLIPHLLRKVYLSYKQPSKTLG